MSCSTCHDHNGVGCLRGLEPATCGRGASDALESQWRESNRKMDNAASRGDFTAYMLEHKANVRLIRAMQEGRDRVNAGT